MRAATGLLLLVCAAVFGAVGGYFVRGLLAAPTRSALDARSGSERDAAVRIELAKLRAENEELAARLAEIARLEEAQAAAEAAPAPAVAKAARKPLAAPLKLKSVDDADALLADAIGRADLDAVLQVGAALLAMGDEGYEKFLALMVQFGKAVREDELVRGLFGDERNAGLALRYAAENIESLLRFGLYLQKREGGDLPEEVRFLREQFDAELGRVLVGFWGGGDPELDDAILQLHAARIAAAREAGGDLEGRDVESAIKGLSVLKSERATQMLLELAENAPESVLRRIAEALLFQGTPSAMAAFEKLTADARDATQREAIEQLLKRRRGQLDE